MTLAAFTLGLTGGIGSGKSTVADMFAELGAGLIDTDLIAHQITAPNGIAMPAIGKEFGSEFILDSGAMNRQKMREHVFSRPDEKSKLEQILHPLIRAATESAAKDTAGSYLIFVVPLLIESGTWRQRVSRILLVDCPEETQIERVIHRNGMTRAQVVAIMQAQASREQRLQAADDVIFNEGNLDEIRKQVSVLHRKYLLYSK
ncbi:dephospho-CoA kinase [Undibacterium parvum]|uniref:Dephospho-CoA kinase n=1 Tax=Undibacterium parvum TaxID=401471 RepID=A0A3Q9BSY4_9BURK|nr:dephospho-CoA kinase [Undibacterium parvum]AZP12955.1 dephospho-CoA kinase [Undibacterium parvum]